MGTEDAFAFTSNIPTRILSVPASTPITNFGRSFEEKKVAEEEEYTVVASVVVDDDVDAEVIVVENELVDVDENVEE